MEYLGIYLGAGLLNMAYCWIEATAKINPRGMRKSLYSGLVFHHFLAWPHSLWLRIRGKMTW